MLYFWMATALFLLRYLLANTLGLRQKIYFLLLLGLFLFSAFRYQVGCDWSGYYYQYQRAADFDWSSITGIRDPIWWAILGSIQEMGLPYPVANIASSAVFFLGFHVLARRQPDPLGFLVLAFPILIINMPMSGIRQGAAIGLLCVAFCAFIDRRTFRFVFWVMLAAGFHSSAMIFLLLSPLVGGKHLTAGRLVLTVLLAMPGVLLILSGDAADVAIERYIETDRDALGAVFRVAILALSGLYFFIFLRRPWARSTLGGYTLATVGGIGMLVVGSFLPISTVIADRISYYLIPLQIMIFARIPYLPIRSSRALYTTLPYIGLLIVFAVWTLTSSHFQRCYLPYQSWIIGFPSMYLLRN